MILSHYYVYLRNLDSTSCSLFDLWDAVRYATTAGPCQAQRNALSIKIGAAKNQTPRSMRPRLHAGLRMLPTSHEELMCPSTHVEMAHLIEVVLDKHELVLAGDVLTTGLRTSTLS